MDGDELKLVMEGKVFSPGDEVRSTKLEVGIQKPEKVGTHRVVQELNRPRASHDEEMNAP